MVRITRNQLKKTTNNDHQTDTNHQSDDSQCEQTTTTTSPCKTTNICGESGTNSDGQEVTNAQLLATMLDMNKSLSTKLSNIEDEIKTMKVEVRQIGDRVTTLEHKIPSMENSVILATDKLDTLEKSVPDAEKRLNKYITELEKKLVRLEIHDRKNNLLFYGISKSNGAVNENTESLMRDFLSTEMGLNKSWAESLPIVNVHRLPKSNYNTAHSVSTPPPIIMHLVHTKDKELILRATSALRGKKITVRTDLPPDLKRERGKLANVAYNIRQTQHLQTRIRVIDIDMVLETRPGNGVGPWQTYKE